jgi:hypothetical protein
MTIADLQEKRAALVAALGEGALLVIFHSGGTQREVKYRSVVELERAISAIDREIAANSGTRISTFLPYFSKGF